jgi:hypothetical protein
VERGFCTDGTPHDIVDPDDRTRYDRAVLSRYDETAGPRPNLLWSWCARCSQCFRWSVSDQEWRPWPGGLALLPHLNDEELDELHVAIRLRMEQLGRWVPVATNPSSRAEVNYKLRILQSLDTAVQEARYGLYPPEGPYEPRLWGEAWRTLEKWVQAQLDGINRSSPTDMGLGAGAAFEAMKAQLERMKAASSGELLARRRGEIDPSPPQPGSADLN